MIRLIPTNGIRIKMKIKKISEFGLGIGEIGKRKSKIGKRTEGAKEKRDVALSGPTFVTRVSRASPFVKI